MEESATSSFFSIIIPVYNVAPYLRECLDSVLAQTFHDWEVICIDDGSTDESGAILDEYADKDKRFRVFHQANAGVSAARNKGVDAVKGEVVVFLDGDDVLEKHALELMQNAQRENPDADLFYLNWVRFNDGERVDWGSDWRNPKLIKVEKEFNYSSVMKNAILFAYRSELIRNIHFERLAFHEDRIFYIEALIRAKAYCDIGRPLYGYRMRNGSVTHSPERSMEETACVIKALPRMLDLLLGSGRRLEVAVLKSFSKYILERIPYQIVNAKRYAQKQLWDRFFEEVSTIPTGQELRDVRWGVYKTLKSRMVAILCGAFVHWLRMKFFNMRRALKQSRMRSKGEVACKAR